jgi:hypothetical protein
LLSGQLRSQGNIGPFLDKWRLVAGDPWQQALEQALSESKACAVFIGPGDIGPWQNEEFRVALDARIRDKSLRIMPVFLPGVRGIFIEVVSPFLGRFGKIDFRKGLEDVEAFRGFVAGIRGEEPGHIDHVHLEWII